MAQERAARERAARGTFIVVDGVDGAGKGTQLALLRDALVSRGHQVHVTAEPSTWPIGALIRRYLRHELAEGVPSWESMALLFAADRMQHVEHEIEPHLMAGEIVLCDRYDSSSIAYQAALAGEDADGARMRWIATQNDHALRPDLVVLLDVTPEVAAARRDARGATSELYEQLELQRRVRANYGRLAEVRPHDRVERIDASGSPQAVHALVLAPVLEALRR
jgi:dTMP kinase